MRRMNEDFELDRKPLTWNYAVSVLKTFVHYYGPHRRLFYLSMTCALAQAAFTTIIPLLVYDAFNTYLPARDYRMIWITVCLLAVLTILVALAMFVCTKYGHVLGVRMEADMRNDLFAHLQRLSFKTGQPVRSAGAGVDGAPLPRPHDNHHCAPSLHGEECGLYLLSARRKTCGAWNASGASGA